VVKSGLIIFERGLMSTKRFNTNVLVLMAVFMLVGGCAKCYRVTDTSTNTVYYTHHVERTDCGVIEFRDLKTQDAWSFGQKIKLKSAQIEEVPQCQCRVQTTVEPPCPESYPKEPPCPKKNPCPSGSM
jgi:hypothetical protein